MEQQMTNETKSEVINKVVSLVNNIMGFIDLYEPNRPGSIAITKLEEAVMWCQVMINNVGLKQETLDKIAEQKVETAETVSA